MYQLSDKSITYNTMKIKTKKYIKIYETETHLHTESNIPNSYTVTKINKMNSVPKSEVLIVDNFELELAIHNLANGKHPPKHLKTLRVKHHYQTFDDFTRFYSPITNYDTWRVKQAITRNQVHLLFDTASKPKPSYTKRFVNRILKEEAIKPYLRKVTLTPPTYLTWYKHKDDYLTNAAKIPTAHNNSYTVICGRKAFTKPKDIRQLDRTLAAYNFPNPLNAATARIEHGFNSFESFVNNYKPKTSNDFSMTHSALTQHLLPFSTMSESAAVYHLYTADSQYPYNLEELAGIFIDRMLKYKPKYKRKRKLIYEHEALGEPKISIYSNAATITIDDVEYNANTVTDALYEHSLVNETHDIDWNNITDDDLIIEDK